MDDSSVQLWITGQLTPRPCSYTMGRMGKPYTPTTYRKAFVQRVRASRIQADQSPLDMAKLLGIPKDTYHRYETRTLLPHHLLQTFCNLTGQDLYWLVTGSRFRADTDSDSGTSRKLA